MIKRIVFLFIAFCIALPSFSQSTNDAGLWTTCTVEKGLKNNFSIILTQEFRLRENFTRLNLFYTELGVAVRPVNFLKVSLTYRTIEKFIVDNTFSYRHRLSLDILLKKRFGNIIVSLRQRTQSEVRNINSSDIGNIPEWYFRERIQLKYDFKKPITPYISTEFRYQINNPRAVESNRLWHRNRYCVGLDYKKNDRHSFGLYYLIQREYAVSAPQNLYIIGLEYSLSL